MFIIQVTRPNDRDFYLDSDMRLVLDLKNAQVYEQENWAIAAKKFIRSQWGFEGKILDYNPAV
jgi:hypothetical protein